MSRTLDWRRGLDIDRCRLFYLRLADDIVFFCWDFAWTLFNEFSKTSHYIGLPMNLKKTHIDNGNREERDIMVNQTVMGRVEEYVFLDQIELYLCDLRIKNLYQRQRRFTSVISHTFRRTHVIQNNGAYQVNRSLRVGSTGIASPTNQIRLCYLELSLQ